MPMPLSSTSTRRSSLSSMMRTVTVPPSPVNLIALLTIVDDHDGNDHDMMGTIVSNSRADLTESLRVERVPDQVEENLLYAERVADADGVAHVDALAQLDPLLLGLGGKDLEQGLELLHGLERETLELEPLGLDALDVEDVVDQRQHVLPAVADDLGVVARRVVPRCRGRDRLEQH